MRHLPGVIELGWDTYLGQTDTLVPLHMLGRYPVRVQEVLYEATQAFETVLVNTGYENPCDWIGSYNKRPIVGTDFWSKHSYGIAIDLDYGGGDDHPFIDHNPHVHRQIVPGDPGFGVDWQILEHQVRAVEAILNLDGHQIWRWLGWTIGDTMHFEAIVAPNACQVDWSTVTMPPEEEASMYAAYVEGLVTGWAEDPAKTRREFQRLADLDPPVLDGSVDYWVTLLAAPDNEEWLGFYARTQLASWGR